MAKPILSQPSLAIVLIYVNLFPELSEDMEIVTNYLETGSDHITAARTTRSILQTIVKRLVTIAKPNHYTFTDGQLLTTFGEKSKMKYYLENKGLSIFNETKKLLSLDELYRDIYDLGSKALKDQVNKYETNLCIDNLLKFLEQLYRYTDLQSV